MFPIPMRIFGGKPPGAPGASNNTVERSKGRRGSRGGGIEERGATAPRGDLKELLKDKTWKIRGVTRNTSSSSAQALSSQGVELVAADLRDVSSLTKACSVYHIPSS